MFNESLFSAILTSIYYPMHHSSSLSLKSNPQTNSRHFLSSLPMGEPCHRYWFSDMEIPVDDFFNQHHKIEPLDDEDKMFREIMHQPVFSSDSETHSHNTQNKLSIQDFTNSKCNNNSPLIESNNLMFSSQHAKEKLLPATANNSQTSYILSFDDSTVVAATRQNEQVVIGSGGTGTGTGTGLLPSEKEPKVNKTTRKVRSSAETIDHIMTERKRRRELTERFIALSATIPGLKKIDKATILSEAITHVKRLKERVRELEEQCKRTRVESVSLINDKSYIANDKGTTSSTIMNLDECYKTNETLPTVEARVFEKDVLLRIHCKIQNGILFKILDHLNSLDLSTISNSVMPFGSSTLDISIVAQVGDKFNVTMNDLVKNLRLVLLQSPEVEQ